MWKGIHSSFKLAQAYRHHNGEKPLFWPQLVLIVAPVHTKKVFFQVCLDVVSTFQYEHIVHLDFSLVLSYALGFSPLRKSLCIFKTVGLVKCLSQFFNVCIGKAFTSVSFYVHLQVVSTKRRFYAYLPCRKPFSSKQ